MDHKPSSVDVRIRQSAVFYISGSGNSFHVAQRIHNHVGGHFAPVMSLKNGDSLSYDLLIFVFPVYDFKPPRLLTEIIGNLSIVEGATVIAIATYGIALSSSLHHFKKTLSHQGVKLSAGYGIKMPHNGIGSKKFTSKTISKRLRDSEQKITRIINDLVVGKANHVERTWILENMTLIRLMPLLIKFLFILIFKGEKALQLTVNDQCIRCDLCRRICPVNNISVINGLYVINQSCIACFACIQWCPMSSIQLGSHSLDDLGIMHHHHPEVTADNLIRQKNQSFLNSIAKTAPQRSSPE